MFLFCDFSENDNKVHFSRARRRFGLVIILTLISVPSSVVCLPEWPDYIEYKSISPPRNYTYKPTIVNDYYQSHSSEVADDYDSDNRENKLLLVGFSHDPYRASLTEAEYYESIRNTNSSSKIENRGKRGVSHLYNMIHCATGCEPLNYKGYGCYCGFQGSGRFTDGIDRCCKMHDQCYENIYCPVYTVYLQPYYWQCINHEPYCALENRFSGSRGVNSCAGHLCECDRRLAMCLRRYGCPRRRALCKSSPLRLLQNLLLP